MSDQLDAQKRARLYLDRHRASRYSGLSDEHRAAQQDILRGLEAKDPGVRERALVGSERHLGRLSSGDRSYQRHWQEEEGLSHEQARQRRQALDEPSQPESRPRGPRQRTRSRAGARRAVRNTGRRLRSSTPAGAAGGAAGLFWDFMAGGILLSILYLLVASRNANSVVTSTLGGITGTLARLASPTDTLLGARQTHPSRPGQRTPGRPATSSRPLVGPSSAPHLNPQPFTLGPLVVPGGAPNIP